MRRFALFLVVTGLVAAVVSLHHGAQTEAANSPETVTSIDLLSVDVPIDRPAAGTLHVAVRTRPMGADETQFVRRGESTMTVAGKPWSFVGVNIYNANSRWTCWYSMSAPDLAEAFAATGATAMRAWFFQSELLTPQSDGTWDWSPFDETIAAARAAGVRIIATLTDHWSACEPGGRKDIDWYRSGYRTDRPGQLRAPTTPMPATYRDYVAAVVSRYRNDPTIMGWQLVNEPETSQSGRCPSTAPAVLQAFAADMAALVRSLDQNHLVSMGTIGSGQCGTSGEEYVQLQQAGDFDWCELHDYYGVEAFGGDERNGMATRVDQCNRLGLPVVIGEAGIDRSSAGGEDGRSLAFAVKIDSARERAIDGYLLWSWADPPSASEGTDQFAIGPGDPVLNVLAESARRWNTS